MENNEDYRRGFEDGVKALAERLERYYSHVKGATYGCIVEYTAGIKAEELIRGIYDTGKQRDDE